MPRPFAPAHSDLRNPVAKARDNFMLSAEGKRLCEPEGLYVPSRMKRYLCNRIESAFIAGWNAKENLRGEE